MCPTLVTTKRRRRHLPPSLSLPPSRRAAAAVVTRRERQRRRRRRRRACCGRQATAAAAALALAFYYFCDFGLSLISFFLYAFMGVDTVRECCPTVYKSTQTLGNTYLSCQMFSIDSNQATSDRWAEKLDCINC